MSTSKSKTSTASGRKKTSSRTLKGPRRTTTTTPKPAPIVEPKNDVTPTLVTVTEPALAEPALRKKELLEAVTAQSKVKRKDAKLVLESTLEVLGRTLAQGREVNVPGLGKLMVEKVENKANARVLACKLRQNLNEGQDTLAPSEKDG